MTRRSIATKFCKGVKSCSSFDQSTSDFPYVQALLKILRQKTDRNLSFFYPCHIVRPQFCAPTNLLETNDSESICDVFRPNDTNLNNFHRESFQCGVYSSRQFYAAYDVCRTAGWTASGAIRRMKERHCGLFSGRVTSIVTPSSWSGGCTADLFARAGNGWPHNAPWYH